MKKRKSLPKDTELAILDKSKRRCALCFHFEADLGIKEGQIAHIDRDRSNYVEGNLAWLCLPHHNQYDTRTSQSKRFQPSELSKAKATLEAYIVEHHSRLMSLSVSGHSSLPQPTQNVPLDIFNVRLPIYRSLQAFLAAVVNEAKVDREALFAYGRETQDALFLYDENIDEYLRSIFREAAKLYGLQARMKSAETETGERWAKIIEDETALLLWFNQQIDTARRVFSQYLNISPERLPQQPIDQESQPIR